MPASSVKGAHSPRPAAGPPVFFRALSRFPAGFRFSAFPLGNSDNKEFFMDSHSTFSPTFGPLSSSTSELKEENCHDP